MKKAQIYSELVKLLPAIIVLLVVFTAVGGTFVKLMAGTNSEEKSTIDSFDNLVKEINGLMEKEGVYNYVENVPIYLGSKKEKGLGNKFTKYSIIVFDEADNQFHFLKKEIYKDNEFYQYEKPINCIKNCICLYKLKKVVPNKFGEDEDRDLIKCEDFDSEIELITISNKVAVDHSSKLLLGSIQGEKYMKNGGITYSISARKTKAIDLDKKILNDNIVYPDGLNNPGFKDNTNYVSPFFIDFDDTSSIEIFYIDFVNTSKLNTQSTRNYIVLVSNEKLEKFRKDNYANLMYKDPDEYAQKILGETNKLNKLILFKEYYDYASLDIIKDNNLEKGLKALGIDALSEILLLLMDEEIVDKLPNKMPESIFWQSPTRNYDIEEISFDIDEDKCNDDVIDIEICKVISRKEFDAQSVFNNVSKYLLNISKEQYLKVAKILADKYYAKRDYENSFYIYNYIVIKKYIGEEIEYGQQGNSELGSFENGNHLWKELDDDIQLSFMREPIKIFDKSYNNPIITPNKVGSKINFTLNKSVLIVDGDILPNQPDYMFDNDTNLIYYAYDVNYNWQMFSDLLDIKNRADSDKQKTFVSLQVFNSINDNSNDFDYNGSFSDYLNSLGATNT